MHSSGPQRPNPGLSPLIASVRSVLPRSQHFHLSSVLGQDDDITGPLHDYPLQLPFHRLCSFLSLETSSPKYTVLSPEQNNCRLPESDVSARKRSQLSLPTRHSLRGGGDEAGHWTLAGGSTLPGQILP